MPIYSAVCVECEQEKDYFASAHEYCPKCKTTETVFNFQRGHNCKQCGSPLRSFRDEARRALKCCSGEFQLQPVVHAPNAIQCVNFENIQQSKLRPKGVYSLGPGFREHVSSKRDIQKLHDRYNKHYEGERYARPIFKEEAFT